MAYEKTFLVRFQHVDFARVVYYPRFFDYCHQVFEDFFADEVGVPYAQMLTERKVGYPTVHAEADFEAPLRFGDTVRVVMEATRVSDRSVTCRYRFFNGATPTGTCTVVTAPIDMDSFKGVALPLDVKAAFERHRGDGGSTPPR